jgi:hypothetical protein
MRYMLSVLMSQFVWSQEDYVKCLLNILFFLLRKAQILFPEFNIRLYDKNSESDFFFLHQNQNIFLEKKRKRICALRNKKNKIF